MSRTYRKYPAGIGLMPHGEARRDGHQWREPGTRFAARYANRKARRDWLNNRERRAVMSRMIY